MISCQLCGEEITGDHYRTSHYTLSEDIYRSGSTLLCEKCWNSVLEKTFHRNDNYVIVCPACRSEEITYDFPIEQIKSNLTISHSCNFCGKKFYTHYRCLTR
jgi:hypothetical protein